MKSVAFVLLLCVASFASCRNLQSCDANCGPKTPPYEVVGSQGATEIRKYENATWAVSFGESIFGIDIAAAVATKGIFAYFAGGNNQHTKIPPSVPLITTVLHPRHPHPPHPPHPPKNGSHPHEDPVLDGGASENSYDKPHPPHHHNDTHPHPPHPPPPPPGPPRVLVGAYVPLKGDVPVPDGRQVKLVNTNTSTVYSHSFGGFAISWLVKREIDHLKVDLKALDLKPCKGKFFVATYDGPWKLIGRKNEVWWTELPHHNHTHHNHTEAGEVMPPVDAAPLYGFQAFNEGLFPKEIIPPLPALPKEPEIEGASDNVIDDSDGWVSQQGRPSIEIVEIS